MFILIFSVILRFRLNKAYICNMRFNDQLTVNHKIQEPWQNAKSWKNINWRTWLKTAGIWSKNCRIDCKLSPTAGGNGIRESKTALITSAANQWKKLLLWVSEWVRLPQIYTKWQNRSLVMQEAGCMKYRQTEESLIEEKIITCECTGKISNRWSLY